MKPRRDHNRTRAILPTPCLAGSLAAFVLLVSGCTGTTSAPAPALDVGPKAWVEFPQEGSTLPMDPVPLVFYATDASGISHIQATINGDPLPRMAVSPMTTDGSTRLGRVDHSWQPPAEGEYFVEAVGVGPGGGAGQPSSTRFCIVTCRPGSAVEAVDTTPTATLTPAAATTATLTPTASLGEVTVEFFASPSSVEAGQCSTLHWDVIGSETVYLDDAFVYFRGMEDYCPCERETHTLRVARPDGTAQDYYATIETSGSCAAPPVEQPPPSDTEGPAINAVYAFWEGCSIYGQADISDPSGVASAQFLYNLNDGGWSSIQMSESGGLWTSQSGVPVSDGEGSPAGNLRFKVQAVDSADNESSSGEESLDYLGCAGSG